MMKRNILAVVIPALLVAGAANAAEIYNKNGNKLDFYGKMVGEHVWTTNGDTSSDDTTYARIGLKGETQINDQLIGYGQWEYNMDASNVEGSQTTKTRLAFAGLKAGGFASRMATASAPQPPTRSTTVSHCLQATPALTVASIRKLTAMATKPKPGRPLQNMTLTTSMRPSCTPRLTT